MDVFFLQNKTGHCKAMQSSAGHLSWDCYYSTSNAREIPWACDRPCIKSLICKARVFYQAITICVVHCRLTHYRLEKVKKKPIRLKSLKLYKEKQQCVDFNTQQSCKKWQLLQPHILFSSLESPIHIAFWCTRPHLFVFFAKTTTCWTDLKCVQ